MSVGERDCMKSACELPGIKTPLIELGDIETAGEGLRLSSIERSASQSMSTSLFVVLKERSRKLPQ